MTRASKRCRYTARPAEQVEHLQMSCHRFLQRWSNTPLGLLIRGALRQGSKDLLPLTRVRPLFALGGEFLSNKDVTAGVSDLHYSVVMKHDGGPLMGGGKVAHRNSDQFALRAVVTCARCNR